MSHTTTAPEAAPLVTVDAPCCSTAFTARSTERAEAMHRDYHNLQHARGRRAERIEDPAEAPAAPAQKVTRYGRFPMTECDRCGATGMFGPLSINGGRCFDCGGTGLVVVRKYRAAHAELVAAMGPRDRLGIELVRRHLDGERVQVAHDRKWKSIRSAEYRLVDHYTGGSTSGVGADAVTASRLAWEVTFELVDGSTVRVPGDLIRSRVVA